MESLQGDFTFDSALQDTGKRRMLLLGAGETDIDIIIKLINTRQSRFAGLCTKSTHAVILVQTNTTEYSTLLHRLNLVSSEIQRSKIHSKGKRQPVCGSVR